jgi:hypothetical protein
MLIDNHTLLRLAERAARELPELRLEIEPKDHTKARALFEALYAARVTALGFALASFAAEKNPRLRWALRATRRHVIGFDERFASDQDFLAECIRRLIVLGGPDAVGQAAPLADSPTPKVRAALAAGLAHHMDDPRARELLNQLCNDGDVAVRAPAREALGAEAPPPWIGVFPYDPLAAFPPKEAAELHGPLRAALEALEDPSFHWRANERFIEAVTALPDNLATPLLQRAFESRGFWHSELAARWLSLPDGGARLVRALDALDDAHGNLSFRVTAVIPTLPLPQRQRVLESLAHALPCETPRHGGDHFPIELILSQCWPTEASLAPLLQHALGCTFAEASRRTPQQSRASSPLGTMVQRLLSCASASDGSVPQLGDALDPAITALEADFPGAWRPFASALTSALVAQRSPRLRALAQRWLVGTAEQATLALSLLLESNYDPAQDPPREQLHRQIVSEPRLRALVVEHDRLRALLRDPLRALLAAGELTPRQAFAAVKRRDELSAAEQHQLRVAAHAADDAQLSLSLLRLLPPEWIGEDERALALGWLERWERAQRDEEPVDDLPAFTEQLVLTCDVWARLGLPSGLERLRELASTQTRERIELFLELVAEDLLGGPGGKAK